MEERPSSASPRARLALAGAMAVLLAAAVIVVGLAGGGSDSEAAADGDCISAWNEDGVATSFGRHNANFHGYRDIRVTRLELAGGELTESESGSCAVIFGAVELDREPVAAGQLRQGDTWTPFTLLPGVEEARVAELQAAAAAAPNATIDTAGLLAEG